MNVLLKLPTRGRAHLLTPYMDHLSEYITGRNTFVRIDADKDDRGTVDWLKENIWKYNFILAGHIGPSINKIIP